MSDSNVIGRFAPTPSGFMHVGNLMCAIVAYLSAKRKGGKFIIRIEDVDTPRCSRGAAKDILDTLEAFGIVSDEPVIYQSERTGAYLSALEKLKRLFRVYPCFCSRAELHSPNAVVLPDGGTLYPGTCKSIPGDIAEKRAKTEAHAIRLAVPDEVIRFVDGRYGAQAQNLARECGDFVVRRRDGIFAYQLAVVVDDGDSGVTEVVRGFDLLHDTPRQIYLQRLLGYPTPEYTHIPLALGADGKKLSKSAGDSAAALLKHKSVEQIIGELAYSAGIIDEPRPSSLSALLL